MSENTAETGDLIQSVTLVVTCPSCGATDYEFDFDADDMASATQVSIPCDECPNRIAVEVDVRVVTPPEPTEGGAS